jgi:hypothetical protein
MFTNIKRCHLQSMNFLLIFVRKIGLMIQEIQKLVTKHFLI